MAEAFDTSVYGVYWSGMKNAVETRIETFPVRYKFTGGVFAAIIRGFNLTIDTIPRQ